MTPEECEEIIKAPGKFEGCARYIPYLHSLVLDGNGTYVDEFTSEVEICRDDIELFPELEGRDKVLIMCDEQGFVREVHDA